MNWWSVLEAFLGNVFSALAIAVIAKMFGFWKLARAIVDDFKERKALNGVGLAGAEPAPISARVAVGQASDSGHGSKPKAGSPQSKNRSRST